MHPGPCGFLWQVLTDAVFIQELHENLMEFLKSLFTEWSCGWSMEVQQWRCSNGGAATRNHYFARVANG